VAVAKKVPSLTAIEPISGGFGSLERLLNLSLLETDSSFRLFRLQIEEFRTEEKFDFIYSINVLEHVPDWRWTIFRCRDLLEKGGECVLMFPNYSFPFETHFNIPIILNKDVTYLLFKNKIKKFEAHLDRNNLWDGLNFIQIIEVVKFLEENKFRYFMDKGIISRMIDRLSIDLMFRSRHKFWSRFLSIIPPIFLKNMVSSLPLSIIPYVKLHIYN
jgi:SAM-dependent methyltransferase